MSFRQVVRTLALTGMIAAATPVLADNPPAAAIPAPAISVPAAPVPTPVTVAPVTVAPQIAPQMAPQMTYVPPVVDPHAREEWLRECRRRIAPPAGSETGKVEDNTRKSDDCETYLDGYLARYSVPSAQGHPGTTYVMGYAVPMMLVPVPQQPGCQTCVKEFVDYIDVPRRRSIPRRSGSKRVEVVPEKRVAN